MAEAGLTPATPASDVGPRPDANAGGILSFISCRRRAIPAASSLRYDGLLREARSLSDAEKARFAEMVWWSEQVQSTGEKCIIIVPNIDDGTDILKLLSYAVCKMHDHVVVESKPFSVAWIQMSDHQISTWSAWSLKRSLHEKYGENLQVFHVVHPSWTVRLLRLALWPIVSEDFWDHFDSHERIEFLDGVISLNELPKRIFEYDTFLDQDHTRMETAWVAGG